MNQQIRARKIAENEHLQWEKNQILVSGEFYARLKRFVLTTNFNKYNGISLKCERMHITCQNKPTHSMRGRPA